MISHSRALARTALAAFLSVALTACAAVPDDRNVAAATSAPVAERLAVEGYWRHDELITSKGDNLPLTGVFLLHNGAFIQQAVMGNPADSKTEAMAHAGHYTATPIGVDLVAEQTISIAAKGDKPLSFQRDTKHNLTVDNTGNHLKLVFGSGTVQTFTRIAPGAATIYSFANGQLAFIGDRFVLVAGDADGVVSGFGTFHKSGETLTLDTERWAAATPEKSDIRGTSRITAKFDGTSLVLEGGRQFTVTSKSGQ